MSVNSCPICTKLWQGIDQEDPFVIHTRKCPVCLAAEQGVGKSPAIQVQPAPVPNESGSIWQMVIEDMKQRECLGLAKYRTPLQVGNGRDHLVDAYQEALDLCVYLRQEIEERRLQLRDVAKILDELS